LSGGSVRRFDSSRAWYGTLSGTLGAYPGNPGQQRSELVGARRELIGKLGVLQRLIQQGIEARAVVRGLCEQRLKFNGPITAAP